MKKGFNLGYLGLNLNKGLNKGLNEWDNMIVISAK